MEKIMVDLNEVIKMLAEWEKDFRESGDYHDQLSSEQFSAGNMYLSDWEDIAASEYYGKEEGMRLARLRLIKKYIPKSR